MKICHACGNPVEAGGTIGRADTCSACDADLHCCLNCRYYDEGAYNDCSETQAERVVDKERSNFCDYFSFDEAGEGEVRPKIPGTGKKNPLDALFKK